jgi:hypothetical protein
MKPKSKQMKKVEVEQGELLETLIPRLFRETQSVQDMAEQLRVNRHTMTFWVLRLGLEYALVPRQE